MHPWARNVLFLVLLVPGVSFATTSDSPRFWGCVSTFAGVPVETWHDDIDTPHSQCLNFFVTTNQGNVTYASTFVPLVDASGREFWRIQHRWTGTRTSTGATVTWGVDEYGCVNPQDNWVTAGDPSASYCEATDTELKNADIATFSGYLIGAFFIGYSFGYMFRVFYKLADHV